MSEPLYKVGDKKCFSWHRQLVDMEILAVRRRILLPWRWKYLIKYKINQMAYEVLLYSTTKLGWIDEGRVI